MIARAGDQAGRQYWDEHWRHLAPFAPYDGPPLESHVVIAPYVRNGHGKTALEIGCVPGNFLVYLAKEFGYRVSGIDYSERIDYVRANLAYHGVDVGTLYQGDFFAEQIPETFDLVFSSGFVEHFADHQLVITKHAALVKPGGLVVVIVPNLTHIHRLLCSTFDRANFDSHVRTLMDRRSLRQALEAAGLHVLHCDFQKTFRPVYFLPPALAWFSRALQKALLVVRMDDLGNRFGSPYLVSVSRRPVSANG